MGSFELLRRPEKKQILVLVRSKKTRKPINNAKIVFLGAHAGKTISSSDEKGFARLSVANTFQLMAVKADGFRVFIDSIDQIDSEELTIDLEERADSIEQPFKRLPWYERSANKYETVSRQLLGELVRPGEKESTFYRQSTYFAALAQCEAGRYARILSDPDSDYEHRDTFFMLSLESIFNTKPKLAAQITTDNIADLYTRAVMLMLGAIASGSEEFADELFGESALLASQCAGERRLYVAGMLAEALLLANRKQEAKQLIRAAWESDSTAQLRSVLESGEPKRLIGESRRFCPALAIIEPETAIRLIKLTCIENEKESLISKALTDLSLCDWDRFIALIDQHKITALDSNFVTMLDKLPQERLARLHDWAVMMAKVIASEDSQLQLLLIAARTAKSRMDRDQFVAQAISVLNEIPKSINEHYYWDPGGKIVTAILSTDQFEAHQIDEFVFALALRAPDKFEYYGTMGFLANLTRVLAIRDTDLARKTLEPALRYNNWLFHDRNVDGFKSNYILRTALWIDPQWAAEETRSLGNSLSSDNPVRPLQLRAGVIEDSANISNSLRKFKSKE